MASFRSRRVTAPPAVSLEKASPQPVVQAIVAAATRVMPAGAGQNSLRIKREAWTAEAYRQYDICGELHFATNWLANSVGRCKLTICEVDAQGNIGHPTKNQDVLALAAGILQNPGMQGELLTTATKNLTIAGDGYILIEPNSQGLFDEWYALSARQVSYAVNGVDAKINVGDGISRDVDLDTNLLLRNHRPHPDLWAAADSPTRAALPVLRELEELSKYLFATINSRLAGAGILGVPSEMTFPDPVNGVQAGETPFMATLAEGMLAPIEDMGSVSALVPIVIQAPREALAGIQWITSPNSTLSTVIADLRRAAIERLALALDLAPDTLFGTGNSSRWGQWTIEEQSIKFHIEPVMILICSALTQGFLTPVLTVAGLLGDTKYVFWYDPSDLTQRPDQGAVAKDLWDRGELSGAALRRETGFNENDAPSGAELEVRNLLKVIQAAPQAIDQLLPAVLEAMGLGHIKLVPIAPPDGTPPQNRAPADNPDQKPMPSEPKAPKTSPNKDGSAPE